jgi:glutamate-ammonia-ligase adenylyltransferase
MESELAPETQRRRNFKTGRGGLLDVETVVQYLQLRHGGSIPELLDVARVDVLLARLAENSLLTADAATTLREGWTFLQQLSSRLRVGENRSISDFDSEGGDLEGLARRLGYGAGGARRALIADYQRHTEQVRGVYEATLRPAARSSG